MLEVTATPAGVRISIAEFLVPLLGSIGATVSAGLDGLGDPGMPLVAAADPADLDADPLLRLELEVTGDLLADRIREATTTQDANALGLLRSLSPATWMPNMPGFTMPSDRVVSVLVAESVAADFGAWANRVYVALRTTELDAAGQGTGVGVGGGIDAMLGALGIDDGETAGDMSPVCALFGSVAAEVMAALAGLTS